MAGRPRLIGPPGPICPNGHRRTAAGSTWYVTHVGGKPYRQIRCLFCESDRARWRYRQRKEASHAKAPNYLCQSEPAAAMPA